MRRKVRNGINKKLTDEQYKSMISDANIEYIEREAEKRCEFIKKMFTEALIVSMRENGLSETKVLKILDDVQSEMRRRRIENEKS